MAKKEDRATGSTLPAALEPTAIAELMERLAERRDYAGALALAQLVGEPAVRARSQAMLLKAGNVLRNASHSIFDDASAGLGWAERLIGWGADPFAHRGEPAASGSEERYEESFFECVMEGGFWAYAAKLALSSKESKRGAQLAVARMNIAAGPDRWLRRAGWPGRPGSRAQEIMSEGGAPALALGFALGLDPDSLAKSQPWVFSCKDAASVRAFAATGFDAEAKNAFGLTLPEACARVALAKTRQEMQQAAMEALAARAKLKKAEEPAAQNSPSPASGSVFAGAHVLALAPRASWREVERASKAAGLDPLSMADERGNTLLALAVETANWALASELIRAGADPLAVSGSPPIPVALRALGAEGSMSMGRSSMSTTKRQALEKLALEMIDKVDFSWRDGQGRPPLEAFAAAYPRRLPGWRAFDRWIEREPVDPANPLWARAARCGIPLFMLAPCALRREQEPWMAPGLGLLALLATAPTPKSLYAGDARAPELSNFMKSLGSGASAAPMMGKLCAPAQWEAACAAMWDKSRAGHRQEETAVGLAEAISRWGKVAAEADVEAFDMPLMSRALLAGFESDPEGRDAPGEAPELAKAIGVALCVARPFEAGSLVLDALGSGQPRAMAVGYEIWRAARARGADLRAPAEHPVYAARGELAEKLSNHPIWREIEVDALDRASKSSAKMRL